MRTFENKTEASRQIQSAAPELPEQITAVSGHQASVLLNLQRTLGNQAIQRLLKANAGGLEGGMQIPGAISGPSAGGPELLRAPASPVILKDVTVNQDRVTVPPPAGLSFSAGKVPANAPDVTLSVVGDNASVAAGTKIDNATGAITVAADQTGGSAHVLASQNTTDPAGGTISTTMTAPFNFTAVPSGITSTSASALGKPGLYGGEFTHTFTSPGGGQSALERAHVNEQFPNARKTKLSVTGPLATLDLDVNDPDLATAGWDLDAAGKMTASDKVGWTNTVDARPFVANASHPSPSPALPQELSATQNFRNLIYPGRTYDAKAVASTTHRRAIEDRSNRLKAVTGVNGKEIEQDYAGPTVFRRILATPASIPVAAPAPPKGKAPSKTTSTITIDAEGKKAKPAFSVRPPDLGCTINAAGVLTPGTTAGTVTVRAGDSANYDETTVTLTAQTPAPAPSPAPTPSPKPTPGP